VVHGIPGKYRFKKGDKVGIDVGMFYQGFHTDTSTTVAIDTHEHDHFLEVGRKSLKKAIEQAKPGNRIMDISTMMEKVVVEAGFSPVRALTGHGIGRQLHEEPAIPCFVVGNPKHSPKIVVGMVLAIEVMYNAGDFEVVYKNDDGWTIATADAKISGLFEDTVAITENGPVILTN
jgi:methionyl aminopeptidase